MSSNLDKGLDEIIKSSSISSAASKPRRQPAGRGFKKAGGAKTTKSLGKALAAASAAQAGKRGDAAKNSGKKGGKDSKPLALSAVPVANPLNNAKRVVVSNLPLDVNEQAVRSYFQESIGKIRKVEPSYRENGQLSGKYTITFEKPGKALQLLEKFNGQPIDGGKSRLAVQILLDAAATAPPAASLAGRIGLPAAGNAAAKKTAAKKGGPAPKKKAGAQPVKAVKETAPVSKKTAQKQKQKAKPKSKPRTVADLDAEMSDYFASAENEISV